jgi:rubredoxin
MSMMRCHSCGWVVDTDDDPEAIQPYPSHPVRGAPDICVCERCREREEAEKDGAA